MLTYEVKVLVHKEGSPRGRGARERGGRRTPGAWLAVVSTVIGLYSRDWNLLPAHCVDYTGNC